MPNVTNSLSKKLAHYLSYYRSEEVLDVANTVIKKTLETVDTGNLFSPSGSVNSLKMKLEANPDLALAVESALSVDFIETESMFFRDAYVCNFYEKSLLPIFKNRDESSRILSLPCSTGQEVYTIAMINLRNSYDRFHIDGADISQSCIKKCNAAVYDNSKEFDILSEWSTINSYFAPSPFYEFRMSPNLKEYASFFCHDILETALKEKYDAIFCLHLFEHLNKEGKDVALNNLVSCLQPGGHLIMHTLQSDLSPVGQYMVLEQKRYFESVRIAGLSLLSMPNREVIFKYH